MESLLRPARPTLCPMFLEEGGQCAEGIIGLV